LVSARSRPTWPLSLLSPAIYDVDVGEGLGVYVMIWLNFMLVGVGEQSLPFSSCTHRLGAVLFMVVATRCRVQSGGATTLSSFVSSSGYLGGFDNAG
jgi:hypothetical protein